MTKMSDAADQVIALADKFRGILDLADALKGMGSVDQTIAERKAALAVVTQKHEAAKDDLATVTNQVAVIRDMQANEATQHQATCALVTANAQQEAADSLAKAQASADAAIAAKNIELRGLQRTHDDLIAAKRAELADLQAKVDAAQKELHEITDTHDYTVQRIDALKETAKSVLGGRQ